MGVVAAHPQRGLVHKLGIGAKQFIDIFCRVLVTLGVTQVSPSAIFGVHKETVLESVVLRVSEGVDIEPVHTNDTMGGIYLFAIRADNLDLIALLIVDRRFAH